MVLFVTHIVSLAPATRLTAFGMVRECFGHDLGFRKGNPKLFQPAITTVMDWAAWNRAENIRRGLQRIL